MWVRSRMEQQESHGLQESEVMGHENDLVKWSLASGKVVGMFPLGHSQTMQRLTTKSLKMTNYSLIPSSSSPPIMLPQSKTRGAHHFTGSHSVKHLVEQDIFHEPHHPAPHTQCFCNKGALITHSTSTAHEGIIKKRKIKETCCSLLWNAKLGPGNKPPEKWVCGDTGRQRRNKQFYISCLWEDGVKPFILQWFPA